MELDKAFEFAVILAWEDLAKTSVPCSVRAEYRGEPGTPVGRVSVWSSGASGDQQMVCDYWTAESLTHDGGPHFSNGYCSDKLAKTLDFIMTNQGQFTRVIGACRDGFVLIYPPAAGDRTEAVLRLGEMHGFDPDFGVGEVQQGPFSAFSELEHGGGDCIETGFIGNTPKGEGGGAGSEVALRN